MSNNHFTNINAIIFDLGGVLVDWSPNYLYDKIFVSLEGRDFFLNHITTMDWNEEQDAGRSWAEGIEQLIKLFPEYHNEIAAYYNRWSEMLNGSIAENVDILKKLDEANFPLYALTNWSYETFPIAKERYEWLKLFKGIVVSGEEKVRKPDPLIYNICCERYNLNPATTLFIDDSLRNIQAAKEFGLITCHYRNSHQLNEDLSIFI